MSQLQILTNLLVKCSMTLAEAIEDFLMEQRVRGNTAATLTYYRVLLLQFQCAVSIDMIEDLTLQDLKRYYLLLVDREISSVSVQSYIRGLRAFLTFCFQNEWIKENLSLRFRLPKAARSVVNVLSDDEIFRLFSSVSGSDFLSLRNRFILALMVDSGLRRHEVVALRRSDLHPEDCYIVVNGKGAKQRFVPYGKCTAAAMDAYLQRLAEENPGDEMVPALVKVSASGTVAGITDDTIKQLFRRLKEKSGIRRLRPHLLRHTFATRYLENGGNIYSLQMILGHTSLEMVKRYLHLAATRIQRDFTKFSPLDNIKQPSCKDG